MPRMVIHAVGDVGVRRERPASIFAGLGDALTAADIVFGHQECPVSDRGSPAANAKLAMRSPAATAPVLRQVGFHALSLAGNHCLDFGAEALADTVTLLSEQGIAVCGVGANLASAREPAIVETPAGRVAFLSYCSILPEGYAAQHNRPGCAPLRAHTHYEPIEPDQPGTPVRIRTFPDAEDAEALYADIRAAKARAEVVVLSLHWGVHFVRATIADYQRTLARGAIDAGADAIVGHHPHLLKGAEIYKGRPILYSLGNFAIEQPSAFKSDMQADTAFANIRALGGDWQLSAKYFLPEETRHTAIARLVVEDGRIDASLLPCRINDDSEPQLAAAGSEAFDAVFDYVAAVTREAELDGAFAVEGDAIRLVALNPDDASAR